MNLIYERHDWFVSFCIISWYFLKNTYIFLKFIIIYIFMFFKKKYWLALWWWAARWYIHLWVYKYLLENNYIISEIAGTSMWAIFAWCFALGYEYDKMYRFFSWVTAKKLVDFNLSDAVLEWVKTKDVLYELFWDNTFADCKIPLKIIATNIENGELTVFESWKILDAVLCTIAVPTVYRPQLYREYRYLDWWLRSNLPVLQMNSKHIIAVSCVSELYTKLVPHNKIFTFNLKKPFWKYNYEVLRKSVSISLLSQEILELEVAKYRWKKIKLIRPDISGYDFLDIAKLKKFVEIGYKEAEKVLKK